jgi:hypothetical protein
MIITSRRSAPMRRPFVDILAFCALTNEDGRNHEQTSAFFDHHTPDLPVATYFPLFERWSLICHLGEPKKRSNSGMPVPLGTV